MAEKVKGKGSIRQPLTKGAARVPVVMQMETLECGAACLTMVMAYYRKWVPLEQVRVDCRTQKTANSVTARSGCWRR